MPTRSESIKKFLEAKTHADLASFYNLDMECQVNVGQDGGERTGGEFKGRKWHGWTDGVQTWKAFRIPIGANSENPHYDDYEMKFDLAAHVEGVGMTGWDWKNQVSKWVGYDFDAITGHVEGLTNQQLMDVERIACEVEWVTVRKSTSGNGLHLYVQLPDIPTKTHTEHASLGRAILGMLSALTAFDFQSKVDACGGNMWIWHRKMLGTDGLTLIKQGITLHDIPANWRDHLPVIQKSRRKNLPQNVKELEPFDQLTSQQSKVSLDSKHQELIQYLKDTDALWWWDQDFHMLVTHTKHLEAANEALNLLGVFKTTSEATNLDEQNCFCFPQRRGSWSVRRYTKGISEADSWDQDGAGWTRTYLNKEPDLKMASRSFGGVEDTKGGFVFREAETAQRAAALIGVGFEVATPLRSRETTLKQHKDGRLVVEVERQANDMGMEGWLAQGNKPWTRIFNTHVATPDSNEVGDFDDLLRHMITPNRDDAGWVIFSNDYWQGEPLTHIKPALSASGFNAKEITNLIGSAIFKSWKLVNKPFQEEYPGDREWNRNAAQFKYAPATHDAEHPHWDMIMKHCGSGLDAAISDDPWCKANGILNGAEYLMCWVSALFQEPTEPLPYLFFFGPQNSGKSVFHESLNLLLTKGYKRAEAALTSDAGFNSELEGAIICVVEEIDLRRDKGAYNRIKDWVTSRELLIHPKRETPYHIKNTTHWIQCSNEAQSCPVSIGDTRVTVCFVDSLPVTQLIPKKDFILRLEKEAPNFLRTVMQIDLPKSNDRLNLPIIETSEKNTLQNFNQNPLESFIQEYCTNKPGYMIKFSDFHERFKAYIDESERHKWTKIATGRLIPPTYPSGRYMKKGAQKYIGNIWWKTEEYLDEPLGHLRLREGFLVGEGE